MLYNDGTTSVSKNLIPFEYIRAAIIEEEKSFVFSQLVDYRTMPMHYGKEMVIERWIPLLDDRNVSEEGIGTSNGTSVTIIVRDNWNGEVYIDGVGTTEALAKASAEAKVLSELQSIGGVATTYSAIVTEFEGYGYEFEVLDAKPASANLYGSDKDFNRVGTQFPAITETGGTYNQVGFTKIQQTGAIKNYGMWFEYTEDLMNLDNDKDLLMHFTRELMRGYREIVEDMLQYDLVNGAGVTILGGNSFVESDLDETCSLTYKLLMRAEKILNRNKCPKDTTVVSGSVKVNTNVVPSARVAYVGDSLKTTLLEMLDLHGRPAFISYEHYADAGNVIKGEIGKVGSFRFVEAEEMMSWEGAGASADVDGYYETGGKYDVFPVLIVGSGAFTAVGLQGAPNAEGIGKVRAIHKKPSADTATLGVDVYGKKGFYSIQWWYGSLIKRPEWIAVLKVTAKV